GARSGRNADAPRADPSHEHRTRRRISAPGRNAETRGGRRRRRAGRRRALDRASRRVLLEKPQHAVRGPGAHRTRCAHNRRRQGRPSGGGSGRLVTRRAVADRMALCCRQLAERGLMAGQDGNLAVRLGPDRVLVTPTGVIKALVGPADMVEVDLRGRKRRGRYNPTSELDLHLRILTRRPDVATLDAAWIRMESLEHGARIIWVARTLGRVNELSPEAAAGLRRERDVEGHV